MMSRPRRSSIAMPSSSSSSRTTTTGPLKRTTMPSSSSSRSFFGAKVVAVVALFLLVLASTSAAPSSSAAAVVATADGKKDDERRDGSPRRRRSGDLAAAPPLQKQTQRRRLERVRPGARGLRARQRDQSRRRATSSGSDRRRAAAEEDTATIGESLALSAISALRQSLFGDGGDDTGNVGGVGLEDEPPQPQLSLDDVAVVEPEEHGSNNDKDGDGDGSVVRPMIVGGQQASEGEYPYFVQCDTCGASLIAPDLILSAAHCKTEIKTGSRALVGAHRDWEDGGGAQLRQVVKRAMHPKYNLNGEEEYDFLVAKLDRPVVGAQIVRLNTNSGIPREGGTLTVIGFGSQGEDLSYKNMYPDVLQEADLDVFNDGECENSFPNGWIDTASMFCAYGGDSRDACFGTCV